MRQTTEHRSYLGSRAALSRYGQITAGRTACRRRGFTLIEVVIAMSILVVVVLALLSSYTFYYRSITNLRIQSIGENLAQLQLEDVRNMGISSYQAVLGGSWNSATGPPGGMWPARFPANYDCPNYPPAELYYRSTSSDVTLLGWFSYARRVFPDGSNPGDPTMAIGLGNRPAAWSDVNGLIPPTSPVSSVTPAVKENLASITYDGIDRPVEYDSGKRDADFVVEGLTSVPSGVLVLPPSMSVTASAAAFGTQLYTLDISKWTYPYFKKRITITDESPGESEPAKKLYEVAVTVYWTGTANGAQKSYTVKQKVSFEGQVK